MHPPLSTDSLHSVKFLVLDLSRLVFILSSDIRTPSGSVYVIIPYLRIGIQYQSLPSDILRYYSLSSDRNTLPSSTPGYHTIVVRTYGYATIAIRNFVYDTYSTLKYGAILGKGAQRTS